MSGVRLDIIIHKLSSYKEARPTQKKRKLEEENILVTKEKAKKLLSVGFICEATLLAGQRSHGHPGQQ